MLLLSTRNHSLVKWFSENLLIEKVVDVGVEKPAVKIVSHVTAIINAGDQILQSLEGSLVIFLHVDGKQVLRNLME